MSTTTAPLRPFQLGLAVPGSGGGGGGATWKGEAPTIADAIAYAEKEHPGMRVFSGRSTDGGNIPFDADADLEAWMRTHRG